MKVFCIGFHKTGTTSLGRALALLGYDVCGPVHTDHADIADRYLELVEPYLKRHDAFQDNPWPVLFRELDAAHPGSRFIFTDRDDDAWLASVMQHFGDRSSPMRAWIYGEGCPTGHEQLYLQRFRRHRDEVRAHFAGREADYLELTLGSGHEWEQLAGFLGHAVPDTPFPHRNRARLRGLRRMAKRVLR